MSLGGISKILLANKHPSFITRKRMIIVGASLDHLLCELLASEAEVDKGLDSKLYMANGPFSENNCWAVRSGSSNRSNK